MSARSAPSTGIHNSYVNQLRVLRAEKGVWRTEKTKDLLYHDLTSTLLKRKDANVS